MKPINITEKFTKFRKNWHPHQITVASNIQVILAKIKGELFQVVKGTFNMQLSNRTEVFSQSKIMTIPNGVEDNPTTKKQRTGTHAFI